MTRIFSVRYNVTDAFDGKVDDESREERVNVVAVNASAAIDIVRRKVLKQKARFKDDDTGKMVAVTTAKFDPIEVELLAETT